MKKFSYVVAAFIIAVAPLAARAHHSAALYDLTIHDNKVTGVVKKFEARNPHTDIILEITDAKGTREVWFEGHSRNNFYRSGWREGKVKVGDKITLIAAPRKDGGEGGYVIGVICADGSQF